MGFSPAILIEQAKAPSPEAPPLSYPIPVEPVAITVEFSAGVRVVIDATAPPALVTAMLLAVQ